MPTSVALGSYFETFIKEQIVTGRYNNVSEVVRAALRLLEEKEKLQQLKFQDLREAIRIGTNSGDGLPAEEVFSRLDAKYQAVTTPKVGE